MNIRYIKFLIITILSLFVYSSLFAQGSGVAVTAKIKGKTEHKPDGGSYQSDLKRGKLLNDKAWIRTRDDGYIALMFIDDKTLLKLRENSELEIRADRSAGGLNKSILMSFGKVKAEISPQRSGEFTISTPTSVASVKGTIFWIISTPEGDQFVGIEGTVEVTNTESGQTVSVTVGQTATSNADGSIEVQATPEGGVPDDPGETDDAGDELRIRLENADGETKEIIINY